MTSHTVAMERTWFAIAPDGTEHDLKIWVGLPTQAPRGEWRSTVSLGALESRNHSIAGIDSWQAILLAMSFAATRVGHFAEDGWKFYWERGGDVASPGDLVSVS